MMDQISNIATLLVKYTGEGLAENEKQILSEWISASTDNENLFIELTNPKEFSNLLESYKSQSIDTKKAWSDLINRINPKEPVDENKNIITREINYKNESLNTNEENNLIIKPDTKIISDVKIINNTLLKIVKENPDSIYKLTPREFEEFTAELFRKKGYEVILTPQTRDGGKDLIIVQQGDLGNFLIYGQCKKYAPHIPVGVQIVRELKGTIMNDRVTAGMVITSSYFSTEAKSFTEQNKHSITLVDFIRLEQLLKDL